MPSIINATTTNGVAISPDNSGSLQLATNNGTTAVTIDTSQNVGIGTTSPNYKVTVNGGSSATAIQLVNTSSGTGAADGLLIYQDGVNCRFQNTEAGASTFWTDNTERMRIDSSGRVTTPFQPAFHATRDTAFNSGSGVIVFPDIAVNIGSGYNNSTGRFTAPVAGTYMFLVSFFTNIINAPIDFRIVLNGGSVGGNATTGTTTVARDCHAYIIRTLAANDWVEVQAAGFGTNIPSGLGIFQTFSGNLLG